MRSPVDINRGAMASAPISSDSLCGYEAPERRSGVIIALAFCAWASSFVLRVASAVLVLSTQGVGFDAGRT